MKKRLAVATFVLILNLSAIGLAVLFGTRMGNPAFYFEENQPVTFLSALLLGLTGWSSLIIYKLLNIHIDGKREGRFYLLSSIGFFYLCMDEYFMMHEGIDDLVLSLWHSKNVTSEMDGLTIAAFGIFALIICIVFRKEILKNRFFLFLLSLGAISLAGTVIFDLFKTLQKTGIVIEESFKIIGVSFFFTAYANNLLSLIRKKYPT